MNIFISNYNNKIDIKGRVSVPSQFRSVLQNENSNNVVIYPSSINNCIEACSFVRIEKMANAIDSMDPLSEERDAFATSILGVSTILQIDNDGRIVLPKSMVQKYNIVSNAVFIGKGKTFEIWSTQDFEKHIEKSKQIAFANKNLLKF